MSTDERDSDPGPDSDFAAFAAEEAERLDDVIEPDRHGPPSWRDPGPDYCTDCGCDLSAPTPVSDCRYIHAHDAARNAWRDRFDTREEYEER
jgi:hypothetical protein